MSAPDALCARCRRRPAHPDSRAGYCAECLEAAPYDRERRKQRAIARAKRRKWGASS